jgi:hypothetical protein
MAMALAAAGASAQAQDPAQPRPAAPATAVAVPDTLTVSKLVWSSLAALDHANQTGNYSVLRDLGAPSFQEANSAATLGGIFQAIRDQRIDLGNTLVVTPTYEFPPAIVEGGLLRVRGRFPLRPAAIAFDLLFQNVGGRWRLFGISVAPVVAQQPQPGSSRQ